MTVRLELLGTRIDVAGEPSEALDLTARLWSPFETAAGTAPVRDYTIRREPPDAWTLTERDGVETRHTEIWNLMDTLRYLMLGAVTTELDGFVSLHAACVARDDAVVLLPGPSGAGKTTLALALLESGWSYLTDDLAPIEVATGLVHPFPKPLGVKDGPAWERIAARCEDLAGMPRPPATFLVPPTCFPRRSEPCPGSHLVFPRFTAGEPGAVEQLTTAEAVAQTTAYLRHVDADLVRALKDLCGTWRCFRLSYGSTAEALAGIAAIVAGDRQ